MLTFSPIQERAERSAGIRTFPLVALASCGLMLVALKVMKESLEAQARVLEGLIAGIGFIGGGAILKGKRAAYGTATAASVWNVGVIGAAAAYELYDMAVVLSVVNVATLRLLAPFKQEPVDSSGRPKGDST
ncbi:MgtC/SapB family protein [Reyranella sp.]|uniref:MgtC/SapB family protein n=1 Tax=Reyranella sp. TaxID=1929291 RepID=UPI0037851D0D